MRQNYDYEAFTRAELIAEIRLITHQRDEARRELEWLQTPPAETDEDADRRLTRWEVSSGRRSLEECFPGVPEAQIIPEDGGNTL